jgi:hypothetical protein
MLVQESFIVFLQKHLLSGSLLPKASMSFSSGRSCLLCLGTYLPPPEEEIFQPFLSFALLPGFGWLSPDHKTSPRVRQELRGLNFGHEWMFLNTSTHTPDVSHALFHQCYGELVRWESPAGHAQDELSQIQYDNCVTKEI